MTDNDAGTVTGPFWAGRNWAADAGEGSIHDDETAAGLGFRGGTVPADVHLNQFPPVLLQLFGFRWFESGNLSLQFKNATVDGEEVQVLARHPAEAEQQVTVWMERSDGLLVATGTAAMGDHSRSALRDRDLRPSPAADLRILRQLEAGMSLGEYDVTIDAADQCQLYDAGLISDPLDFYRTGSHWGDVIACPSTLVKQLWGIPMAGLRPHIGDAVGLFGAIEIAHVNGPMVLNRDYHLSSEVVSLGQSPQTEYLWFDTKAYSVSGQLVAELRMQLRFMKVSSVLYQPQD